MQTVKIQKFEVGKKYTTAATAKFTFLLKERDGKELYFHVLYKNGTRTYATGTSKMVFNDHGPQEIVRVTGHDGSFTIEAANIIKAKRNVNKM